MRLAMAQMKTQADMQSNLERSVAYIKEAKKQGADIIFFPEIQLSPFFPKYKNRNADEYLLKLNSVQINEIKNICRDLKIYASPNIYLSENERKYDASLFIDSSGDIVGISKMVHIAQAENFYEKDYYDPSDEKYKVFNTPFGKIGIVICFDRHFSESIRACALQGAELVIIPTANITKEPLEMFEWEIRVQAFQNTVFVAMCNRTGTEDALTFAGQSMVASPDGELIFKADEKEQLFVIDLNIDSVKKVRTARQWLFCSE